MGIQIISVSHKKTPISIREKFAFTQEQQEAMMEKMVSYLEVSECVVLSTCNRMEMYVYADCASTSYVFNLMEDVLMEEAGAQDDNLGDYLLFYHGKRAIDHLFYVASGLDSMVIGEDQILGQVKDAHKMARELGTTGVYLNTFFRNAVTAAKKIKTDTDLSRTSVSTATLAIKVAEEELGTLKGKNCMIIGASGKIGGTVLMNLQSYKDVNIYTTVRKNKVVSTKHFKSEFTEIDYDERYQYAGDMDVIISATSSPHYTLTEPGLKAAITKKKPRVFVDLAVPVDIDSRVRFWDYTAYYNIDDFTRISKENNEKKLHEAKVASNMLDEYTLQFEQWMVFQKSLGIMHTAKTNFIDVAEHKGVEKAFDHLFYWVRENNSPEDLETFFRCLNH